MHPPSLFLTALSRVYPANLPSRLPPGMHLPSPTLINHYSRGIPKSLDGWTDGRMEGRKEGRKGRRIRGGRVARLLRIFENVSAERRGGEGVESVMSRNLGVPRIYSRWRGGSTNRACREFAIVIREYGGWFVLWTRLAACNWRMPVFRFFFRVCCVRATRAPQFFGNDRSIVCILALFVDNVVDGTN